MVGQSPLCAVFLTSLHMIESSRPPPSVFAYRKQSKTGKWENACMETRLFPPPPPPPPPECVLLSWLLPVEEVHMVVGSRGELAGTLQEAAAP